MTRKKDHGGKCTDEGTGTNGENGSGYGNDEHAINRVEREVDEEEHCHCQGSRLLVLLGPLDIQTDRDGQKRDPANGALLPEDATMYLAQHWALEFYAAQRSANKHIHMLAYDAPSGAPNNVHRPKVAVNEAGPAVTVSLHGQAKTLAATSWRWRQEDEDYLDTTIPSCCCFFQEVMLIFHGHQAGAYTFIIKSLRQILAGRPVEKLVLWSCRSSERFSPSASNSDYQRITWMVRPKECECGCLTDQCNAFDPDCGSRHCPDGKKPTSILTSGHVNGKPVPLGIDPAAANPLRSPDGRLREITIQPDGTTAAGDQVSAGMSGVGLTFFDGLTCGTDAGLLGAGGAGAANPAAVQQYENANLKKSPVQPIRGKQQGYIGPETESSRCDAAQGCMTGASCNGPDSPP